MKRVYLQITSGRGPTECCRVVAEVLELLMAEANRHGFETEVIEREEGVVGHTLFSAVLLLQGDALDNFIASWEGTVLWIAQSPYRKFHKRKNWFVGVHRLPVPETTDRDERDVTFDRDEHDVTFQTFRASGAGGQHVNKTESAVRVTHLPTGISAISSENRSQLQNKRLALERLQVKLAAREHEQQLAATQSNWQNHNHLQRGNPVKVIKRELH